VLEPGYVPEVYVPEVESSDDVVRQEEIDENMDADFDGEDFGLDGFNFNSDDDDDDDDYND
jgi:hypothetical protein